MFYQPLILFLFHNITGYFYEIKPLLFRLLELIAFCKVGYSSAGHFIILDCVQLTCNHSEIATHFNSHSNLQWQSNFNSSSLIFHWKLTFCLQTVAKNIISVACLLSKAHLTWCCSSQWKEDCKKQTASFGWWWVLISHPDYWPTYHAVKIILINSKMQCRALWFVWIVFMDFNGWPAVSVITSMLNTRLI